MRNHESASWGESSNSEGDSTESKIHNYEERLDRIGASELGVARQHVAYELDQMTNNNLNCPPREYYDKLEDQKSIDRCRLFAEAETLFRNHGGESLSNSRFFRHLIDTINPDDFLRTVEVPALSGNEIAHFNESASELVNRSRDLFRGDEKDRSFGNYLKSLLRMCENVYGKNSRAELYLCDDLNQILNPDSSAKALAIDDMIKRKIDAAGMVARYGGRGNFNPSPIARDSYKVSFTAALDLPDGVENRSLKELVEEGVPSLYGYSDEKN